jgi:hypothetical protein
MGCPPASRLREGINKTSKRNVRRQIEQANERVKFTDFSGCDLLSAASPFDHAVDSIRTTGVKCTSWAV